MRFSILIVFFLLNLNAIGQNLVPNPSFEDTVYCPFALRQIDACLNWNNYGNSPDYFNACNTIGVGVPNSVAGYQFAHSGVAMAGVVLYRQPGQPGTPNAREFIGAQLLSPLQIGSKYYISFYINFSYQNNLPLACNKAGIRFSTVPFDSCCKPPINNWAHLYTDSIYIDSVAWYKVDGALVADSSYNFICLGNFFDDMNTDTSKLGLTADISYYYFDDICVSSDSIYNQTWTSLQRIDLPNLKISPNPSNDLITVSNLNSSCYYAIYDYIGRILYSGFLNSRNTEINISKLNNGVYFLKLNSLKTNRTLTFIKN